jgi:hypothetical protein
LRQGGVVEGQGAARRANSQGPVQNERSSAMAHSMSRYSLHHTHEHNRGGKAGHSK